MTPFPILTLGSDAGAVDDHVSIALVLNEAPMGLSGFHVIITVADDNVAKISDFTYNPDFSPTNKPGTATPTATPSATLVLFAADIGENIGPGDTDILLATIEFSLLQAGQTQVTLAEGNFGVQEDCGGKLNVVLINGTVTVN